MESKYPIGIFSKFCRLIVAKTGNPPPRKTITELLFQS
jgi:hypothetical protein